MSKKSFFGKKPAAPKTPEPPPDRTLDEIKAEYTQICAQAGEEQFNMKTSEIRVSQLNQRMAQLKNEYNAIEAKTKASKESENGIPEEGAKA